MRPTLQLVLATIALVVIAALASGLESIAVVQEPASHTRTLLSVAPAEPGGSLHEDDRDELDDRLLAAPGLPTVAPRRQVVVSRPIASPPRAELSPAQPSVPRAPPA